MGRRMVVLTGFAERPSGQQGWNCRILNQYEAQMILVGALGLLAVDYGRSRR